MKSIKRLRRFGRFATISLVMMVLTITFAQEGFSTTISQLRQDLLKKIERFDARVRDMTIQIETIMVVDKKEMGKIQSKIFRKGPKARIESRVKVGSDQTEEITTTIVYDGKDAWMINTLGQAIKIEDIPKEQMDPTRFIPEDAVISGEEAIDDRPCYIITFKEFGEECYLWLDKVRFVPLKMERGGTPIFFKDYRQVAKMWGIPYRTLITEDSREIVSSIKSVKINTDLSDELFKVEATESMSLKEIMDMFAPMEKEMEKE